MKKQKSVKYIYQDVRFRIIERSGHWNLDFFIDNKRQRRSTSLKANNDNLFIIKKEIKSFINKTIIIFFKFFYYLFYCFSLIFVH